MMFSSSFIWHLLIWYMLKSYKLNDVLFFIHMAFAYLVYAEKLQVCHRVLLEVRLDMFFFVYIRVYIIGQSLPIQPLFIFLVLLSSSM